ncbi:hypothetical protein SEA_BOBBY_140 [Mycobacterium phage Bobby]|nr:hypothetical protein SEA_BOBBY_140 [Mycobacterium phage Bobby]
MESCWHCNRDVHEAPLTERVALMYDRHSFDLEYSADEDDSEIVCIGSYAEGPRRSAPTWTPLPGWTAVIQANDVIEINEFLGQWQSIGTIADGPEFTYGKGFGFAPWQAAWTTKVPSSWIIYDEAHELIECDLPEDIPEIKFGPENWVAKDYIGAGAWWAARQILPNAGWQDIPLPDMPKSDYKALGEELSEKLNPKWSKI